MRRVLLIASGPGELRGVVTEDDIPVELLVERAIAGSLVGAIYKGRVMRSLPSLPGSFLAIGAKLPGFLPGDRREGAVLPVEGSEISVQVVKDAREDKPAELRAGWTLEGLYLVWRPGRPGIAVSRDLDPAERARLSRLLVAVLDPHEGVVVRTRAAGVADADLVSDVKLLRERATAIEAMAKAAVAPARLDVTQGPLERLVLGAVPRGLDRIVIDDRALVPELRRVAQAAGCDGTVDCDPNGGEFEEHGFEDAFDEALAPRIPLRGGAEIIIETTAAGTMIDVNLSAGAGGRIGAGQAILAANQAAAQAIMRQLRLRNLAGAVTIDFIPMNDRRQRRAIEEVLSQAIGRDRVAVELHGWTRLGHFELTRQRGRVSIAELMLEPRGLRRRNDLTMAYTLLRMLARAKPPPHGTLTVHVGSGVAALFEGALAGLYQEASRRAGRPVSLRVEPERESDSFEIAGQ